VAENVTVRALLATVSRVTCTAAGPAASPTELKVDLPGEVVDHGAGYPVHAHGNARHGGWEGVPRGRQVLVTVSARLLPKSAARLPGASEPRTTPHSPRRPLGEAAAWCSRAGGRRRMREARVIYPMY